MHRLSLRAKILSVVIVAMLAMLITVGMLVLNNQEQLLDAMIQDSLQTAEQAVRSELLSKAEQALSVSLAVAGMPEVIAAARVQERDSIVDSIVSVYRLVHEEFGVDVLHVRAPYDTSLVRGQNPNTYGDVQSRGGILDAGRSGQAISGFDSGPFGMGMRGWAPIKDGNQVVGTVETNIAFTEELLYEISDSMSLELAVFVPSNNGYNSLVATNQAEQISVVDDLNQRSDAGHLVVGEWAYRFTPVMSYDGEELAVIAIFQNVAGYQELIRTQSLGLILVLIIGAFLFIGALIYLIRRVLQPLHDVGGAVETISTGNLTVSIPRVESKDEVGTLVQSFSRMVDSLKQMIGSLSEVVDETTSASQQLAASTEQSRASMRQISDTADDFDQATVAMHKITQSIDGISSMASEGNQAVTQAVKGTNELQETIRRLNDFINALDKRSQEIGNIVEMISGIADQTNLLALNAAIEAARAGDEGRGFAVVSEEVRQLAERSSTATTEIAQLISTIQQETQEAVAGVMQSSQKVEETTEIVGRSGDVLQEILQAVNNVTQVISDASTSINHIKQGSQEITASAEEQYATIDEVAETTQALSKMAAQLQQLVRKFKV